MASPIYLPPSAKAAPLPDVCCGKCAAAFFEKPSEPRGECRLDPPKMQFVPVQGNLGQVGLSAIAGWPSIARDAFCITGFRAKNPH